MPERGLRDDSENLIAVVLVLRDSCHASMFGLDARQFVRE